MELRWILMGVGILLIAGVWLYHRRAKSRRPPMDENLIDAVRGDPPELRDVLDPGEIEDLRGLVADHGSAPTGNHVPSDELILTLHVARREKPVTGGELFPALVEEGLAFGRMDIFHHTMDDGEEVFSVASMVEPGTFNPVQPDSFEAPGVTLFTVLPGPLPGPAAFERMLSCARGLAAALHADVLDDTRSVLTRQTEAHLRERVAAFEARHRHHHRPVHG